MIDKPVEAATLGIILLYPEKVGEIVTELQVHHFTKREHKIIFESIKTLYLANTPIDVVTLNAELKRRKLNFQLDTITNIVTTEFKPTNLSAYIKQLKESYRVRLLSELAAKTQEATENGMSSGKIITSLQKQLTLLTKDVYKDTGDITDALETYKRDKLDNLRYDTNIPKLDDIINKGLKRGQIMVLAGESGAGKSYLAENLALYQALIGFNVLFFSTELSKAELFRRAVCMFQAFNQEPDFELAEQQLSKMENFKIYSEILTSDSIISEIKRQNLIQKVDLVVIDHLQDIEIPEAQTEYETIRRACMELKDSAQQDEYALILASQLKSGTTGAYEFHGARKIRQIAHVTLVIKNEEVNGRKETALIVDKNRSGRCGVVSVNLSFPEGVFYQS